MASRKWLFISVCLLALALLGLGGGLIYLWIQSGAIRTKLIAELEQQFQDVDVQVGSVWWFPWSSIRITDLTLTRRSDPSRLPFLEVPHLRIYPDKEQFTRGRIVLQKIELERPHLRIEREASGRFNLENILRPKKHASADPMPMIIVHGARLAFTDRSIKAQPLVEASDLGLTVINDPVNVFRLQLEGKGKPRGSFAIHGKYDQSFGFAGHIELNAFPVGPELIQLVTHHLPEAGNHIAELRGQLHLRADLTFPHLGDPQYDATIEFHRGRWAHPWLHLPIEQIQITARLKNGDLTVERATAQAGTASIAFAMELPRSPIPAPHSLPVVVPGTEAKPGTLAPGPADQIQDLEDRLHRFELSVVNLTIRPELLAKLPPRARIIDDMLAPAGMLNFHYDYHREKGGWSKKIVIEPLGMSMTYRGFPYPLTHVRGTIEHSATNDSAGRVTLHLLADGAGTTVSLDGTIVGTPPNVDVDLRIAGKNVTLDKKLIAALPDENPQLIERLRATAVGDFVAFIRHNEQIRRDHGPDTFDNLFTIDVKQGSMQYEEFPYRLDQLSGRLTIRTVPDRPTRLPPSQGMPVAMEPGDVVVLEFKDFVGRHAGGIIRGSGRKEPVAGGSQFTMNLEGENVALDSDLQKALAALRLESVWTTFEPRGRINCNVRVRLTDRSSFGGVFHPPEDLELSMAFAGGQLRPNFFPYQLTDVAGRFSFAKRRLELKDFRARHEKTDVSLPQSEIIFRPGGGYWADLRDLHVSPLILDDEMMKALPSGIRSALTGLVLQGGLTLHANRLVIDERPGPYLPESLPVPRDPAPAKADATLPVARGQQPDEIRMTGMPGANRSADKAMSPTAVLAGSGTPAKAITATSRPLFPAEPIPSLPTIYWDGMILMNGVTLKTGVDWEDVHGKIASWGLYQGNRLGAVRGNVVIDRASLAGQPVASIRAQLRIDPRQPDVLQIPSITGKIFGGDVGGEGWVVMQTPVRYAITLNAARIRLSEIARHYQLGAKVQLEGLASAQLYLMNKVDERLGIPVLEGEGNIDVPHGRLLNLPFLINLIKVAKLRVPDETGFEEAHIAFRIRGERVKFGQLDLIGNAISLGGEGEMNIDGKRMQLEFYPVWTKVRDIFALPGELSSEFSKRLFKIRVVGELGGKMDFKPEPVPVIMEPMKRVIQYNRSRPRRMHRRNTQGFTRRMR